MIKSNIRKALIAAGVVTLALSGTAAAQELVLGLSFAKTGR